MQGARERKHRRMTMIAFENTSDIPTNETKAPKANRCRHQYQYPISSFQIPSHGN
jgi:hypothetical protein